eukprot:Nk52_evm11s153 gene=Nk52_evmTU11s153
MAFYTKFQKLPPTTSMLCSRWICYGKSNLFKTSLGSSLNTAAGAEITDNGSSEYNYSYDLPPFVVGKHQTHQTHGVHSQEQPNNLHGEPHFKDWYVNAKESSQFKPVVAEMLNPSTGQLAVSLSSMSFDGFLRANPRGAYTGMRTVGLDNIMDWNGHMQRLAQTLTMVDWNSEAGVSSEGMMHEFITQSRTTRRQLMEQQCIGRTQDGVREMVFPAITADVLKSLISPLAHAAVEKFNIVNNCGSSSRSYNVKLCALVGWVPDSLAESEGTNHIRVMVHASSLPPKSTLTTCVAKFGGRPRKNPLAKDSAWVSKRSTYFQQEKKSPEGNDIEELILHDHQGRVYEGASSNFLAVHNGIVYCAPPEHILEGTILKLVREVCAEQGIPFRFQFPRKDECHEWEGCLITSTSRLAMPVRRLYLGDLNDKTKDSGRYVDFAEPSGTDICSRIAMSVEQKLNSRAEAY